jgi:hypothetical protein
MGMTDPTPNRRWFHTTPDRIVIGVPRLRVFAPSSLSLNIWQVEQVAKGR